MIKKYWWKYLSLLLIGYSIIGWFLMTVPRLPILHESIRNLYFHVPLWFGMVILFSISLIYAIKQLRNPQGNHDLYSFEFAKTGLFFGFLGIVTGMIWANYTWGSPWHGDPKQNGSAIALLVYCAYFILRGSLTNQDQKVQLSAVYNIFAFFLLIPLIFILPQMTSSMHPGNGGNPGFNMYDLNSNMRLVFYPAVIGWILLGVWLSKLHIRLQLLKKTD